MTEKSATGPSTLSQSDRFRAMAEELECDPDEAAFKAKLAVIARHKPKSDTAPPQPKVPTEPVD